MKNVYDILGLAKPVAKTRQEKIDEEPEKALLKGRFRVLKSEDEKRLAFGWASIAIEEGNSWLTGRKIWLIQKNWKKLHTVL